VSKKKIKAYVTKYALTQGIMVVESEMVEDSGETMIRFGNQSFPTYAHGNDWYLSEEAARARVEEMRQRKLAALRKQVVRLEKLKIKVMEVKP